VITKVSLPQEGDVSKLIADAYKLVLASSVVSKVM
jgi:hypothetical protein